MAEQFSEEQLKEIRDKCTDKRTDTRYTVLSQDEITTLFSAYEAANAPEGSSHGGPKRERQVRLYDFARPDRFSKEHLRALQLIHETFCAELSTELSNLCAAATRADLISIEQVTHKQYRASISPKTLMAEVSISSMMSTVVIAVNSSIVGVWVDYLCGGNPNIPAARSDLTPLDVAVARNVLERVVQMYAKTWPGSASVEAHVERAADAELCDDSLMSASETVLVCNYELQTGTSVGMMTICIPATGVEQMMPAVSEAQSSQSARRPGASQTDTPDALSPVELPCSVVLGTATASLSDLANCEIGDVLRLNKRAGDEAEFWVGSRHVFNCRPGSQRGNVAIVISGLANSDAPSVPDQPQSPRVTQAEAVVHDSVPHPIESQGDVLATAA